MPSSYAYATNNLARFPTMLFVVWLVVVGTIFSPTPPPLAKVCSHARWKSVRRLSTLDKQPSYRTWLLLVWDRHKTISFGNTSWFLSKAAASPTNLTWRALRRCQSQTFYPKSVYCVLYFFACRTPVFYLFIANCLHPSHWRENSTKCQSAKIWF